MACCGCFSCKFCGYLFPCETCSARSLVPAKRYKELTSQLFHKDNKMIDLSEMPLELHGTAKKLGEYAEHNPDKLGKIAQLLTAGALSGRQHSLFHPFLGIAALAYAQIIAKCPTSTFIFAPDVFTIASAVLSNDDDGPQMAHVQALQALAVDMLRAMASHRLAQEYVVKLDHMLIPVSRLTGEQGPQRTAAISYCAEMLQLMADSTTQLTHLKELVGCTITCYLAYFKQRMHRASEAGHVPHGDGGISSTEVQIALEDDRTASEEFNALDKSIQTMCYAISEVYTARQVLHAIFEVLEEKEAWVKVDYIVWNLLCRFEKVLAETKQEHVLVGELALHARDLSLSSPEKGANVLNFVAALLDHSASGFILASARVLQIVGPLWDFSSETNAHSERKSLWKALRRTLSSVCRSLTSFDNFLDLLGHSLASLSTEANDGASHLRAVRFLVQESRRKTPDSLTDIPESVFFELLRLSASRCEAARIVACSILSELISGHVELSPHQWRLALSAIYVQAGQSSESKGKGAVYTNELLQKIVKHAGQRSAFLLELSRLTVSLVSDLEELISENPYTLDDDFCNIGVIMLAALVCMGKALAVHHLVDLALGAAGKVPFGDIELTRDGLIFTENHKRQSDDFQDVRDLPTQEEVREILAAALKRQRGNLETVQLAEELAKPFSKSAQLKLWRKGVCTGCSQRESPERYLPPSAQERSTASDNGDELTSEAMGVSDVPPFDEIMEGMGANPNERNSDAIKHALSQLTMNSGE